jgi:hypothetical protein
MWENFIGEQIRRCNRNLLVANIVLLCAVVTCAAMSGHYLATEIAADHCAAPARRRNSGIRRLRGQQELPSRTKHPLFPD